ncbi:DUF6287 domain-containing protein [Streptococcus danieliae]|uniref:DUF6287 domain-containing protein n=1 Tax=Streptococcus danieliae TaxID=747656 RepID=A0A7X3G7F8_9STRE|nr:DUF6287 domain-containing protein [Streptococcus danieliae]MCU0082685.1 DUF6287 domain-containing protein [Streptococcus danieliae]MVX58531.1 hypothetical protein [Streptococcus danieliae]NYS32839.1 hypothetical protein [Streptococcus danieliae]
MNIEEILAGDFSSIAGTWENDYEERLVFDDKGLVSETYQVTLTTALAEGGFLSTQFEPIRALVGGALIRFIPSGIDASNPDTQDRSKHFKDRIWLSQSNGDLAFAREFYYKID